MPERALCYSDPSKPERRQHCEHAEAAAALAVKKTFAILGVNIDEPREVREFQESLRFADNLRKRTERGFVPVVIIVIGLIGSAFIAGVTFSR